MVPADTPRWQEFPSAVSTEQSNRPSTDRKRPRSISGVSPGICAAWHLIGEMRDHAKRKPLKLDPEMDAAVAALVTGIGNVVPGTDLTLGGGTVLAARYNHRRSFDLDLWYPVLMAPDIYARHGKERSGRNTSERCWREKGTRKAQSRWDAPESRGGRILHRTRNGRAGHGRDPADRRTRGPGTRSRHR